ERLQELAIPEGPFRPLDPIDQSGTGGEIHKMLANLEFSRHRRSEPCYAARNVNSTRTASKGKTTWLLVVLSNMPPLISAWTSAWTAFTSRSTRRATSR